MPLYDGRPWCCEASLSFDIADCVGLYDCVAGYCVVEEGLGVRRRRGHTPNMHGVLCNLDRIPLLPEQSTIAPTCPYIDRQDSFLNQKAEL